MDDYLIVLANYGTKDDGNVSTSLLSFNLKDYSVQEGEIEIGSFKDRKDYSFLKYGENQIIKYDGNSDFSITCITVESFEPFKVLWEVIEDQSRKRFSQHTVQIFQDSLYIYGKVESKKQHLSPKEELWSFDLKNRIWRFYETTGEAPELSFSSKSFMYQGDFYVYGAMEEGSDCSDLFMIDLNSMEWIKIEQTEEHLDSKFGGAVYKDHLVVLKKSFQCQKNALCFLNLQTKNTWATLNIKDIKRKGKISNAKKNSMMVYQSLVLSLTAFEDKLVVALMNLADFEISIANSTKEESFSGLFLRKAESDVTFKVGNQLAFAHSKVLVKNSRYFASLWSSGGDIGPIEIQDCEFNVFKKYLRFLYQKALDFYDDDQTMKLYILAERYLEEDLCEKCLEFLHSQLNMNNVYKILDFAHQENICEVRSWCLKLLENRITVGNAPELIKYLCDHQDPEFRKNLKEIRIFAFNFVLDNLLDISQRGDKEMQVYESFLMNNIEMDTISALARFVSNYKNFIENEKNSLESLTYEARYESEEAGGFWKIRNQRHLWRDTFIKRVVLLREAAFSFVRENVETMLARETAEDFMKELTLGFLFMSQIESDITFEVEGRLIPAHKEVLMKKSRYFEKVLSSGMAESRQEIIHIEDCKYDVFKEYLRFIYQNTVSLDEIDRIFELTVLADKYLQEDLCKECVDFLISDIKMDNVYKILDFAYETNITDLKDRCTEFLEKNLDVKNVLEMIGYLNRQDDPEFTELVNSTFDFILGSFFAIVDNLNGNMQACEDFLLKNIRIDTIACLVCFLIKSYYLPKNVPQVEARTNLITKEFFDKMTIRLKEAAFGFIQENGETVLTSQVSEAFSKDFLLDFSLYLTEKVSQQAQELMMLKDIHDGGSDEKRRKKRMEPVKNENGEEKPVLKKMKKD